MTDSQINEYVGLFVVLYISFLLLRFVFRFHQRYDMSKIITIAILVGAIFSPTQTKIVTGKVIDFTHAVFTVVTQHINANSK